MATSTSSMSSKRTSGQHLSIKDLRTIFRELYEARTKWNNIGLELGMNHGDLAAIKRGNGNDPSECFQEMLSYWLKQVQPKRPTWETLVSALESQTVGYEQLAEGIKERYLSVHTQSNITNSTTQPDNGCLEPSNSSNGDEKFHCPCGRCDLITYLDNGCPQSSSSQYPYLNLSELDEDDKEDVIQKLSEDTANIIQSFADLLSTTSESLNNSNVEVKKLVKVALDLGAFKSDRNQSPLLDEDRQKLEVANSIDSAFIILGKHMSFNYEILSHIINHLGSEEDKENLAKYCRQFLTFCECKVFEVPPCVFDPSGQNRTRNRKLFVVLGTEDLFQNLNDVKAAQRKIASLLGLRVSTLQLKRVDFGSVILVFSIPVSVAQLLHLNSSIFDILSSNGFTLIIPDLPTLTLVSHTSSHHVPSSIRKNPALPVKYHPTSIPKPLFKDRVLSPTSSHRALAMPVQKGLTRTDQLDKLATLFKKKNKKIGVFYDSKQKQKADSIVRRLNDLLSGGVCIIWGFEILPLTSDWLSWAG